MSTPDHGIFRIQADDGWELEMTAFPPTGPGGEEAGEPLAACVVGHAMGVNRRSLDRPSGGGLASTLAASGLAVYTFDCRGHGGSRPGPAFDPSGLRWRYEDIVSLDLPAVTREVRSRHPDLSLAVIGHSLVGHAAVAAAGLDAGIAMEMLVGLAPNVWLRSLEPSVARWAAKRALVEAWHAVTSRLGLFPARQMGLGTEDVSAPYVADFVRWVRTDRWDTVSGRSYLDGIRRLRVPTLFVVGEEDRVLCTPEAARAFGGLLTHAALTLRVVGSHEIAGLHPDHMQIVTSQAARPLWQEIAGWIVAHA